MSRLRRTQPRKVERESTIPLINVVFLLLVFFIVAGTLSAPRDNAVELAHATTFDPTALDAHMIYIDRAGETRVGGIAMSPTDAIIAASATDDARITVVPDRHLDAATMIALLAELGAQTEKPLAILTQRPGQTP